MIVIADSNKIMSAIYKPVGSEAMMFAAKSKIQFLAPDYVVEEFQEHIIEITKAIGLPKRQTQKLFSQITDNIKLIELASLPKNVIRNAIEIVKEIDPEDAPFIALHLYTKHKIWTGDMQLVKGLKRKGYDICITTAKLRKSLYKR